MNLSLFCLLAVSAAAGPRALPAPAARVHPLLLGELGPMNPFLARMDFHAGELLRLSAEQPLTPSLASSYLEPLAVREARPADRLAADVLSRVLADPSSAHDLTRAQPFLQDGRIDRLSWSLFRADPYRGAAAEGTDRLFRLASGGLGDPGVTRLFDGSAPAPDPDLMGVGLGRRGLRDHEDGARLHRPEHRGEAADVYAHPRIEGAALEVLHEGARAWEKLERVDSEGTRRSLSLGRAGLAPRLLALDAVFEPRIGNDPMHLVRVRERVYGSTVEDLVMRFRFTDADKELARALARSVLEAGYGLAALTPGRILLGTTLADPARRAYLAEPSGTAPLDQEPSQAAPADRLRRWLADFERRIWKLENDQRGGGGHGFGSLKY